MRRDHDKLLKAGNAAQIEKLKKNDYKDGYDKFRLFAALKRIDEERDELLIALVDANADTVRMIDIDKLKAARLEFADISNFCHFGISSIDNIIVNLQSINKSEPPA